MENRIKILIVEDSQFQAIGLKDILEKEGKYEIKIANNGENALKLISKERFHIVITDWVMPEMEGPELIKKARERVNKYIYFILLTAKDSKNDLIEGINAGADDFLSKPFNREELLARVRAGERIIKLENKLEEKNRILEIVNKRMKDDLDAAAQFQKSLLPDKTKEIPGIDFYWYYKPSTELAGDIFNIFQIDENNIGFYLIDVSGHGVSAALMAVTLYREFLPNPDLSTLLITQNENMKNVIIRSPGEVAKILNSQYKLNNNISHYFTFIYLILDKSKNVVKYVSAGHPGFIYIPGKGDIKIIQESDFPIGFVDEVNYNEYELKVNKGDRIIIYSDGVIEVKDKNNNDFGTERLIMALDETKNLELKSNIENVVKKISEWNGKPYFDDDVSILGVEIKD